MNQTASEKFALRAMMKEILRSISASERNRQSTEVLHKLLELPEWKTAKNVLCYAPMENEVNIWPMLKQPLQSFGQLPQGSMSRHPFHAEYLQGRRDVNHPSLGKVAKPEEVAPKLFFLSRINPTADELEFFSYHPGDELIPNQYGILEPTLNAELKIKNFKLKIDVVLAPGLAFTKDGKRLGRGGPVRRSLGEGGGYYDRFLKNFPSVKIGLCFHEQIVEEIPTDEWDTEMDIVLSP